MKLHAMEFSGTLLQLAEHLNTNGLAEFDLVASRTTFHRATSVYSTEVILRVPEGFEEARWGANAYGSGYRAGLIEEARRWRRGDDLPPPTITSWEKIG